MDICSNCGKSVCCDLNSFDDQKQCTCTDVGDRLIEDLRETLNESFHIQDVKSGKHLNVPSDEDDINHVEKGTSGRKLDILKTEHVPVVSQKCFCRCKTFPSSGTMSSCSAYSNEDQECGSELQENSCAECSCASYLRTMSLPTPLKLASAMKGSREKQGMEPKKLTVSWAPDVYDPPPTSLSHVPKSKGQQRSKNNKKNGKNKQKGKASRGSGSKDKKQFRKISGSSDFCYKPVVARDRLVFDDDDFADPDEMEFNVGSPDPYCGSSFFKKSLAKVHMSVAEAL